MSDNYMLNEVVKYWKLTNDLLVAFEDFNGQIQKAYGSFAKRGH